MTGPILEAAGVGKTLQGAGEPVVALRGVDLRIMPGEFVAITGPSGSGKSTLLYLLGALDRPTEGVVKVDGQDTRHLGDAELARLRNRALGFVFQFHFLMPELTARDNVALPLRLAGVDARRARAEADVLLARFELSHRAEHLPSALSGGQQQRVAIARALANRPRVLLGDELTGNLDTRTGERVYELLRAAHRDLGLAVVLVTHNPELAGRADRRVTLVDGRLAD